MRPILLHGHTRPLTQIKYNREGDLLFTCGRDKSPNVWFAHNGERLGSYDGHNGAVYGLDMDHDTQFLLTGSADNTAKLWNAQTGEELYSWEFKTAVRSVEFALGDRQALILTDARMGNPGMLHIFAMSKRVEELSDAPLQSIVLPGKRSTVARWGSLNRVIYTGHEDGTVMVWDPVSGSKMMAKQVHSDAITDIQLSKDKTYLITSSKDQTARILDAKTLEEKKVYTADRPLNSATLSPIFDQVVTGGGQEARDVTTTSAKAGRFEALFHHRIFCDEIGQVKGHFGPINTLAFHPDGKSFSSGGEDGYVRIHHFDPDYFEFVYE